MYRYYVGRLEKLCYMLYNKFEKRKKHAKYVFFFQLHQATS